MKSAGLSTLDNVRPPPSITQYKWYKLISNISDNNGHLGNGPVKFYYKPSSINEFLWMYKRHTFFLLPWQKIVTNGNTSFDYCNKCACQNIIVSANWFLTQETLKFCSKVEMAFRSQNSNDCNFYLIKLASEKLNELDKKSKVII